MQVIQGILLEPVGCLAEFPSEPFHEIAVRLFGRKGKASKSASRSYWHLLNLMEAAPPLDEQGRRFAEALETEAAVGASVYEDVLPALAKLHAMGVQISIATSLSRVAGKRFLESSGLSEFLCGVWSRDDAGGVKAAPLQCALQHLSLPGEHTIFLTDTAEGLKAAERAAVNAVLMMNDPDEARRLALHHPAGGVVSLHELPDFVRLVRAQNSAS